MPLLVVTCSKVEDGLSMKEDMLEGPDVKARARPDAETLIGGGVGSFHETTPEGSDCEIGHTEAQRDQPNPPWLIPTILWTTHSSPVGSLVQYLDNHASEAKRPTSLVCSHVLFPKPWGTVHITFSSSHPLIKDLSANTSIREDISVNCPTPSIPAQLSHLTRHEVNITIHKGAKKDPIRTHNLHNQLYMA